MIKVLFLFFFLLNAACFYTQFVDTDESASSTTLQQLLLPQGVDRLVLLNERDQGEGVAPLSGESPDILSAQKVAGKPSVKSIGILAKKPGGSGEPVCFTLGPFALADVAGRSSKALVALEVDVKQREVSPRRPRGYWVYLPASKSYQAARRKVRELQKKGLKDLYIMGKGGHENAISLGLFTRENAANNRFQQVSKLGLKAVQEIQYRVSRQIWLDLIVVSDQAAVVTGITGMANRLQQAELTQRQCQ